MLRKKRGLIPTVEIEDEGRQTPWHWVMGGLVSLGDPSLVLRSFLQHEYLMTASWELDFVKSPFVVLWGHMLSGYGYSQWTRARCDRIILGGFSDLPYVHECFICLSVCVANACLVPRGQKRVSCPLELELWVVVSLHMVAEETKVWSSARSKCS